MQRLTRALPVIGIVRYAPLEEPLVEDDVWYGRCKRHKLLILFVYPQHWSTGMILRLRDWMVMIH